MDENKRIEDLVAMLDKFVIDGGGHMNIEVEDDSNLDKIDITTQSSTICNGNMACQVPTLQEGLDNENNQ